MDDEHLVDCLNAYDKFTEICPAIDESNLREAAEAVQDILVANTSFKNFKHNDKKHGKDFRRKRKSNMFQIRKEV